MDTARSLHHLHAAYILTWCVHLGYVLYLVRGFLHLKREAEELRKP
jgi:hypothetical protein